MENKMVKNFYLYDQEELLKDPKLPLILMDKNDDIFQSMAEEMVEEIERKNELNENTVLITPVGPVDQYPYFVELVNKKKLSLKNVWFISMDEYLDEDLQLIDENNLLSFRRTMNEKVYSQIDSDLVMPEEQRIYPDPNNLSIIPELIEKLGGVDIAFGGIGINGHVAFNEPRPELSPEGFKQLTTRVEKISTATTIANSMGALNGAIEELPKYCVTIGMKEIYGARKVRLGCFRNWHRAVVRRAAHGEVSAEFPVSLLQDHPNANVKISEYVARLED